MTISRFIGKVMQNGLFYNEVEGITHHLIQKILVKIILNAKKKKSLD